MPIVIGLSINVSNMHRKGLYQFEVGLEWESTLYMTPIKTTLPVNILKLQRQRRTALSIHHNPTVDETSKLPKKTLHLRQIRYVAVVYTRSYFVCIEYRLLNNLLKY